jgi:ribosomal protein S18 acetylase RimI-like enzyme
MRGLVTVRPAEPDDVPTLVKITEEGDPHHPARTRSESPADREHRFEELVADPRRVVEVACDDDGLIVGLLVATAEDLGTLYQVPALTVSTLMVIPSCRRRGAGRALLISAVQEAERRGVECLVASVSGADRDANRYLARLGFAPLVVRRLAQTSTLRRTLGMNEAIMRSARWHRRRRVLSIRALNRDA